MAECYYTTEAVLELLDASDDEHDLDDMFFPGSDDELGLVEEEVCEEGGELGEEEGASDYEDGDGVGSVEESRY